jgi:hypothetical protein
VSEGVVEGAIAELKHEKKLVGTGGARRCAWTRQLMA